MAVLSTYSGIVLNQNRPASGTFLPEGGIALYPSLTVNPSPTLFPSGTGGIYQTFQLPGDHARGAVVPPLTGLQVCAAVTDTSALAVTWTLDQLVGGAWRILSDGICTGASVTGQTWLNLYFPETVALGTTWATDTFRLSITGATGISGLYYSSPNPLTTGQAFLSDGTPILTDVSFLFRVLGHVADSGTDFLGNVYRATVAKSAISDISAVGNISSYWVSQPNPSQFGVESCYLDMRSNNDPVVLDRMTLDPITPGVYAHVYFSNDSSGPGVDPASWDNLLWTPAYLPVQMMRQQTYAFPYPLTAKYLKVEFTNLQPRHYDPGAYQIPCTFRKFPQWVLDFFLGQFASLVPDLLSSGVDVTYDALDLAYSYYTGDLTSEPKPPALATQSASEQNPTLFQQTAPSLVDATTLAQIRLAFRPFTSPPGLQSNPKTMLGALAASTATSNYSTETVQTALGDTSIVSNLQREALLVEKAFPTMFFFWPCRHSYRISQALFESNIGYFAGVRQLAFHRETYTTAYDQTQYTETFGDGTNLVINDWVTP